MTEEQVLGREGAFPGGGALEGSWGAGDWVRPTSHLRAGPRGPSACASYSCVLALPPQPHANPLPSFWALPHLSPSPTSLHLASLRPPSSRILPQAPHQLL